MAEFVASLGAVSAVPMQLLDKDDQAPNPRSPPSPGGPMDDGDDGNQSGDEQFSILGHCVYKAAARWAVLVQPARRWRWLWRWTPPRVWRRREMWYGPWGTSRFNRPTQRFTRSWREKKKRRVRGIELIASENFVCRAVMEGLGSHLTDKYSEGLPGARYYTGNQYIDQIESLCCQRALAAFGLDSDKWGVNVQPYSCTSANFAVYTGPLLPGDRIMGLDSPSGGHSSHGYYTPRGKKVSASSIFFESLPYKVNPQTGYIEYDKMEEKAMDFRPKILICGGISHSREGDYTSFRQVADKIGAVLMCDIAHMSGLVAAKV